MRDAPIFGLIEANLPASHRPSRFETVDAVAEQLSESDLAFCFQK